ncbi:ATP-independent periplasmic protein-refolding chaperone Spy [Sodalis sp. RH21]|uniref:ATP-independent periplasmic protein-refolding chaperone Spy n=1 Tax=unclassified Sodalis (in: enterobacteria) TaxID=2636512 RepID=UPI0039B4786E
MRKLTALFMATTLVLGSVQLASAADTAATAPASGEMQHRPMHGGMHGPMMDHMFKGLKLTDQQREQMKTIARDSMKDMKRPSAAEHQQMHDVIAADTFDSAKAQALVNSMAQEQNQRMLAHLETQNKMYNVLTAEQKQEFNKQFQQRAEKMAQKDGK